MFFLQNWRWWDKGFSCVPHLYIQRLITSVPPPETLWDTLRHIETLWDTVRQLETTWDNLRQLETTWDTLRQLETTWDNLGHFETQLSEGIHFSESHSVNTKFGVRFEVRFFGGKWNRTRKQPLCRWLQLYLFFCSFAKTSHVCFVPVGNHLIMPFYSTIENKVQLLVSPPISPFLRCKRLKLFSHLFFLFFDPPLFYEFL